MKKAFAVMLICLCAFVATPVSAQDDYTDEAPDFYYGAVSNDLLTKIPIRTLNNINLTTESGPLFYRVRSLEVQSIENASPAAADQLGIADDSCTAVSAYIVVENRSDNPVCGFLWKNRLITDTSSAIRRKEAGDLCADVYQPNGSETVFLTYIFDDLAPSDITTLTFAFPNPKSPEGESLGSISKIHINLDDYIDSKESE